MILKSTQFTIPPEGLKAIQAFVTKYNVEYKTEIQGEEYIVTINGYCVPAPPMCEHINKDNAHLHVLSMTSTWIYSLFYYGYCYEDWIPTDAENNKDLKELFMSYIRSNRNSIICLFKSNIDMYTDFLRCGKIINEALGDILGV